jgi:hypothetical protein
MELVLKCKEGGVLNNDNDYTFSDLAGGGYTVKILSFAKLGLIPFYITKEGVDFSDENGLYFHIFEEDKWEDYYTKIDDDDFKFNEDKEFVFKSQEGINFEIDKWCCSEVKDRDTVVMHLCDSMKPAFGSFSERVMAMHSRLTDSMREEMVDNLNSITYGHKFTGAADDDEDIGGAVLTEKLTSPEIHAPAGSSPYALRGEHIRRSLLNRGVDATETIDSRVCPWELDFAINQSAKWNNKVKSMVFSVVGALITSQPDRRGRTDDEKEKALIRDDVGDDFGWPTNPEEKSLENRKESCAAPIWDSGSSEPRSIPNVNSTDFGNYYEAAQVLQRVWNNAKQLEGITPTVLKGIFGDADTYQASRALKKQNISKLTKLERLNSQRDSERDMMVKGGVFPFKRDFESKFANRVYEIFSALTDYEKTTVTLVYKDKIYPDEGFSYPVPTVIFGPSNSVENSAFSIGHGVNLLMEGTEIAASFLQYSTWASHCRLTSDSNIIFAGRPRRKMETDPSEDASKNLLLDFEFQSDNPNKDKPVTFENPRAYKYYKGPSELDAVTLADWLASNFVGYCYERAHVVDKPMFAKLVSKSKIAELYGAAVEAGFVCTASAFRDLEEFPESDLVKSYGVDSREKLLATQAKAHLFFLMKHETETSNRQTVRRMRCIVQPFLVSVTSSSMGTGVQSFMHLEDFWGPRPDFFSVEAECMFILRKLSVERFQRKRRYTGASLYEGTVGEVFSASPDISKLYDLISKANDMQAAAAIAVRLIESVQAANEGVIDGGRTQRDLAGREYVNQARFSYATQLLQLPVR